MTGTTKMISIVPEKSVHVDFDFAEYRRMQETEDRRLYLYGTILSLDNYNIYAPASPTATIVENIDRFNREDSGLLIEKRKPIILYINSPGGDVTEGFSLVDRIAESETPVYTVNTGQWSSMAFLIGISGHKRLAYPSSTFLLHDGSSYVSGSSNKVYDQAKFVERFEKEIVKPHILSHSKLSSKEYDAKSRVEWYMFATEAKKYGFIDEIGCRFPTDSYQVGGSIKSIL